MVKIELALQHFGLPDNAGRLIEDCKDAGDEIGARPVGRGDIPQFEPADGRVCWHVLNAVTQQIFHGRPPVFCEWGSGLGLIAMLASLSGMRSTGIEIEEELFDLAREFSQQHGIPATFINGSIYPADNPAPLIDYKNIDLFFAYPWPNQIAQMTDLFSQVAASGSVLVFYHGGPNCRVLKL
ncbi:hypothetical protein AB833_29160 [Chromatiales bacterium (ex Bugula neritina AB1)]|nr:hypothetical protein AB833_29160 [Chromatiales bacterium (ex Bugula neritina AB1)]